MLIFSDHFGKFEKQLGIKTKNLKVLQELGLEVPRFIAIPTSTIESFFKDKALEREKIKDTVKEIIEKFPLDSYAVRSSALIEDNQKKSFAGQFQTKLAQKSDQLETAIVEIVEQAFLYLQGDIQKFSLIIQEYIEADYAGVAFTRSPMGEREMVLEYHRGRGEDIVSGKITPEKIRKYWDDEDTFESLPYFQNAIKNIKKIESCFKFPQDIEWCIKNGKWYFLQTRPMTNIDQDEYEGNLYLDKILPKKKFFLFEKTEIAPRPTPFTMSLLRKLYGPNGPIQQVYKKYGIQYQYRDFLKIVGNELYVDRNEEIKTLLPSYSYNEKNMRPQLKSWHNIATTLKNIFRLNAISLKPYGKIEKTVQEKLQKKYAPELSLKEKISNFMEDYKIIFEINLLAEKAFKRLETSLKSEPVSSASALSFEDKASPRTSPAVEDFERETKTWKGNSLEINDETDFFKPGSKVQKNPEIEKWFLSLPNIKKTYLKKIIIEAKNFSILREYGRWLTIKNINTIRLSLQKLGKELNYKKISHLYFFSLPEIIENANIEEEKAIANEKNYRQFDKNKFPSRLSNKPFNEPQKKQMGISKGKAKGKFVDISHLDRNSHDNILYTEMLTPDLTQYFGHINGIISEKGGLLSHLAIIAREKNLPVIVNFNKKESKLQWNDSIEIDGAKGEIIIKNPIAS